MSDKFIMKDGNIITVDWLSIDNILNIKKEYWKEINEILTNAINRLEIK